MKPVANLEIREQAKKASIPLWQIADELGLYDFEFSKMLRHELSGKEKDQILRIIQDLQERTTES